ncbi:type ISP restriction/modification enzyme [Thiospirillum jenense]|uniref:site-specific DNA-methyltransferase (adenine-specific) n=1 Tax=Thiospirillum jenense TaxID=1653858 RepID=A0A839H8A9_9GAMM|nr:type ISP restriction/modification enzyme [Thiospirillum jenense]MBB1125685.1 N-6 DNA methylase [Thiospirillum jenense]
MSLITSFFASVSAIYANGAATEYSYRPALTVLFNSIAPDIIAINEPKRIACGAPDFILQRSGLAIGYVEAKDVPIDLTALNKDNLAQQHRYRYALPNLIYTNCLDWQFFRDGQLKSRVSIGALVNGQLVAQPDQFAVLENLLHDFIQQRPATVTNPRELAERMAGKAVLIRDVLHATLIADQQRQTELANQFAAFQQHLISDISPVEFADVYAETIAYGLFAARVHYSGEPLQFTRQHAVLTLPKSNPLLRALFGYIANAELDERIAWIVDELTSIFQVTNMPQVLAGFGQFTGQSDPVIHFYETFLAVYNPAKRKTRGVWYTPEPVVNFIVRAVDEVLKTEFCLIDGLADTSQVIIDFDTGTVNKDGTPITIKKAVHRVQILDPATGTGTFLAAVIKQIAPKVKDVAAGMWSRYLETDLIPRLHGFELLMASYAMCHLKLDLLLTELGYVPTGALPRLSVYLTNSLEEGSAIHQNLPFAQWLSNEARGANVVKRNLPIMCVIGNPPYSGESVNKSDWITQLMAVYKKEPGGQDKLNERNPKWINDDYVKFIRLAEHFISKNGEGVLGFITNHGYLDNPTFRGMRWQLLNTFDKIYVLDLHGNAKKKEVTPDGQPDKNVFDIQQGVAILIAVKKKTAVNNNSLAAVFHADLWGERAGKYTALQANQLTGHQWQQLPHHAPQYPFVRRNNGREAIYNTGFSIQELMPVNSVGIVTARDSLTIDLDKMALWQRVQNFAVLPPEQARVKYDLGKDVRDWRVEWAQADVKNHFGIEYLQLIAYRPFDYRWTYYTGKSRGFMCYPRNEMMRHLLRRESIILVIGRQGQVVGNMPWNIVFVHTGISDLNLFYRGGGMLFPLYLYSDDQAPHQPRRVNFNSDLYQRLQAIATDSIHGAPTELAVFDYIYGVLHCPAYREQYAEFLKTDFPRIPWPPNAAAFWSIADKGTQLRQLHLMAPAAIGATPYPFIGDGQPIIDKPRYFNNQVWINQSQYFADVPAVAWTFYIGGYQPAQKWLKDRKGRELSFEEIKHYQRIIKILSATDEIMRSIALPNCD